MPDQSLLYQTAHKMTAWGGIVAVFFLVIVSFSVVDVLSQTDIIAPTATLGDPELLDAIDAYMEGKYELCYDLFNEACEQNPNLAPPGVLIALLFSNDRKDQQVFQYLERAADESPDDPEAFYQLAGIAIQEGRYLEARLLIEKGDETLTRLKTKRTGENDSRIEYLTKESFSLSAGLAQHKKNYEAAQATIRKMLAEYPLYDQAWLSLGFILFEQDKLDEALEMFQKAKSLNAQHTTGWLLTALLLQQSGKMKQAQELVDKALAGQPLDKQSLSLVETAAVARLFFKWDRLSEAEEIIDRLRDAFGEYALTWELQGELALYRSEFVIAEDSFRKALLINSDSYEANLGMVLALCDQRDTTKLKKAEELAKQLYQLHPQLQEMVATYGWMLFLTGRHDDAESIFATVLGQGQITSTIAYYLAEMAFTKGGTPLALDMIELALSRESNFPKKVAAKELRDIIYEELHPKTDEPLTDTPVK